MFGKAKTAHVSKGKSQTHSKGKPAKTPKKKSCGCTACKKKR